MRQISLGSQSFESIRLSIRGIYITSAHGTYNPEIANIKNYNTRSKLTG